MDCSVGELGLEILEFGPESRVSDPKDPRKHPKTPPETPCFGPCFGPQKKATGPLFDLEMCYKWTSSMISNLLVWKSIGNQSLIRRTRVLAPPVLDPVLDPVLAPVSGGFGPCFGGFGPRFRGSRGALGGPWGPWGPGFWVPRVLGGLDPETPKTWVLGSKTSKTWVQCRIH